MGLLQSAVQTYDAMAYRAGQEYAGEREPLAPIAHIVANSHIQIELDQDGRFLFARAVDEKEAKILIPVTEGSAGRTSINYQAHPLCEQLSYLAPSTPGKIGLYLKALEAWANSPFTHPMLRPILTYVKSGTILNDLASHKVIQCGPDGTPKNEDALVRWVVNGLGEDEASECWRNHSLQVAFTRYYMATRSSTAPVLCMISGDQEKPAVHHPRGIISKPNGAKLISSNDSKGFTFLGRFTTSEQAATVGYTASQKAHSALRWLVANQGVLFGGRTFLCWNPQGNKVPSACAPLRRPNNKGQGQRNATPTQYRQQLREALSGWKTDLPEQAGVIIASLEAATTGRLSLTYYNELLASDFLQRLKAWDESCCWAHPVFGVQSPPLRELVNWAFGTPRNGKAETDGRLLGQQIQRLMACRLERAPFPRDIEQRLVEQASNLILFKSSETITTQTGEKGKRYPRSDLLFTACAAIRKTRYDYNKEEKWDMGLNMECEDRSYLFGRLLAVADSVESSAYAKRSMQEGKDAGRETNAMQLQRTFSLQPLTTWQVLEEKLQPYYKQLDPGLRQYYKQMIQEIMSKISIPNGAEETQQKSMELNRKLDAIYLIGFCHQKAYRSPKNSDEQPQTQPTAEE